MKVKGPKNGYDDLVDSLTIACYPFLSMEDSFDSTVVDYAEIAKNIYNPVNSIDPRVDTQWLKIKQGNNPYDFLLKEGGD